MKQSVKIIIVAVVFIVVLVGGVFAYNRLSENYTEKETTVSAEINSTTQNRNNNNTKNTAPDFTVVDYSGKQTTLSEKVGKPVVINFWASWCGPCKSEFPAFENAYQNYGNDVEFMMINLTDGYQETVSSAKSYIDDQGYTFPVYYDTTMSAANTYSVFSIPRTLFIDKEGNIVENRTGALSEETLEQNIENLL